MKIVKVVLVALAAVALGWFSVGVSLASMLRSKQPEQVLAFYPLDARARANSAEFIARTLVEDRSQLPEVERRARAALSRDLTVVDAWRLLGITAALRGEEEKAGRLVRFAERISRRDLPTQLWLIEENVRRDALDEVLRHYDIALRTSRSSWELLFPVLIKAVSDPNIARPLARLLAANPPWLRDFSYQLTHSEATGDTVPLLVAPLARGQAEREIMVPMVQRLAAAGDFENAWRVYRLLKQSNAAAPELLRNGGFNDSPTVPPFDWVLSSEGAISAQRRPRPEAPDDVALFLRAEAGANGDGASQLLLLEPGRHTLSFTAGSIADAAAAPLNWRILCANEAQSVLAQARVEPARPTGARQSQSFTVPANCPAQSIGFAARSTDQISAAESWIDDITIVRQ